MLAVHARALGERTALRPARSRTHGRKPPRIGFIFIVFIVVPPHAVVSWPACFGVWRGGRRGEDVDRATPAYGRARGGRGRDLGVVAFPVATPAVRFVRPDRHRRTARMSRGGRVLPPRRRRLRERCRR